MQLNSIKNFLNLNKSQAKKCKNMTEKGVLEGKFEKEQQKLFANLAVKINKAIELKTSKHLFLLKISNLSIVTSLYGVEKVNQIVNELISILKKNLKYDDFFHVNYNILAFISDRHMDEERMKNLMRKLKSIIQFFNHLEKAPKNSNESFHLKFEVGVVEFPKFSDVPKELFEHASNALANVRTDLGQYFNSYNSFLTQQKIIKSDMAKASYFKEAITQKRLRLAYQPIINGKNGKINHYECLLRIIDDDGNFISAGPYIEIAEKFDFIDVIDELVLEMVIEEIKKSYNVKFAFNLSSLGIYNEQWLERAKKLFENPEIASRVIVEITETAIHKDIGKVAYFIAILQEMGCQVALDDFGTGHTSFRQLKSLPVDIIKIDGSFIKGISSRSEDELFIKVLLQSLQSLGFKSVAEFVENGEVAKILMNLGIDYMQGHYFSEAKNHRDWDVKVIN